MQIIPMRDLKNTVEIERRCAQSGEPVFVTKNGYGCLVVMDMECYERTMRKINEAAMINKGIQDYEDGRIVDGKSSLAEMSNKYGI